MQADGVSPAFELFVPRLFVLGVERLLAGGGFEENRAYASHVGSHAESVAACLPGGHVIRRSHAFDYLPQWPDDAEVEDFGQLAFGYYVRGLQVQVQDVVAVEVMDGRAQVEAQMHDIAKG